MGDRLQTLKYTFTVEGETEQWYLKWLEKQINTCSERTYNVVLDVKVSQNPGSFYKSVTKKAVPEVFHVCDIESREKEHIDHFRGILSEMKNAKTYKKINYRLGYSNFTFELWMVLHKKSCNGQFSNRKQYLKPINDAYDESFEDLDHFKNEKNFKHCLSKLSLSDVKEAIHRADMIMKNNADNNRKLERYKGFEYYLDNPSLSIHEIIRRILKECGLL